VGEGQAHLLEGSTSPPFKNRLRLGGVMVGSGRGDEGGVGALSVERGKVVVGLMVGLVVVGDWQLISGGGMGWSGV
jgi:hypothetical protein